MCYFVLLLHRKYKTITCKTESKTAITQLYIKTIDQHTNHIRSNNANPIFQFNFKAGTF